MSKAFTGFLDMLMTLVEAYETKHHPIDPPDPVDAILFRMDQQGLTRKDLEPILSSRSRVSEVMNRNRTLSLEMVRKLHKQLDIPLETLVGTWQILTRINCRGKLR